MFFLGKINENKGIQCILISSSLTVLPQHSIILDAWSFVVKFLNLKQKEFIESAISEKVDKNEVFRNKYYNMHKDYDWYLTL